MQTLKAAQFRTLLRRGVYGELRQIAQGDDPVKAIRLLTDCAAAACDLAVTIGECRDNLVVALHDGDYSPDGFGRHPYSYSQIAEMTGLSKPRVQQLVERARRLSS